MRVFLVGFLVVWVAACSPVKVQTDVKSTVNLSDMKTFDWLDSTAAPGTDARVNNPELAHLVRTATEKNLLKKGFVKSASADFLVNWLGAIEDRVQTESIQHFYSSYGYGTLAAGNAEQGKETAAVRSYEEGVIIIDILDPQKHILLWRGKGTRRLMKGMSKAQVARYINLSADEILKNFPPNNK